ncbi:MAG: hypothetical protein HC781_06395 [Leptolyngbyaceae cyanobacterium CSU_1_4]|nr:hypothetical protein [Leptolyngbyaceae cyanobacterium CSU_1_4]
MAAQWYNLLIEQGAKFSHGVKIQSNGQPLDLNGYTARAQVRSQLGILTATFVCSIDLPTSQVIWMLPTAATTLLLPTCKKWEVPKQFEQKRFEVLPVGSHLWDLELVDAQNEAIRLLQGGAMVTPEATL